MQIGGTKEKKLNQASFFRQKKRKQKKKSVFQSVLSEKLISLHLSFLSNSQPRVIHGLIIDNQR